MGRTPCCDDRLGLKKGPWTPDEDEKLVAYVQEHGHGNWRALPEKAGLARCGKSCRLRWTNYLRPDIKRGRFSHEEEQTIIQLHAIMGNRWSAIASHLPRRTDNEIKNYWNTHLKKRLTQMGIDPVTHKTSAAGLALSPQWTPLASTRLSHMTQWEIALAEARARLSKTMDPWNPHHHHPGPVIDPPHPSSFFMRSWKTKLEENPSSPIAPTPIATRHSRNWQTVLGLPQDTESTPLSTAMVKIVSPEQVFPDSDPEPPKDDEMFTLPASRCSEFSYNYDVAAENVYNSSVPEDVAIENLFSPTSILQGPDSESCSTSASGNHNVNNSDCFATFLRHSSGYPSSGFQSLALVDEAQDIPETFWQADGNGLLGAHPEGGLPELMVPLDFASGDGDQEFLPFDSLCHGAQ